MNDTPDPRPPQHSPWRYVLLILGSFGISLPAIIHYTGTAQIITIVIFATLALGLTLLVYRTDHQTPPQTTHQNPTTPTVPATPDPPPAGWYPDPDNPTCLRWWNGQTWTNQQHQ